MKSATLRDGSRAHVGDMVEFFWDRGHLASGKVTAIFRATTQESGNVPHGNSTMLSVVGREGYAEVPARHAWKADR